MNKGGWIKCSRKGCSILIRPGGGGLCEAHLSEIKQGRAKQRGAVARAIQDVLGPYATTASQQNAIRIRSTAAWTKASRAYRAEHPWCADPYGVHGEIPVPSADVHHVVPVSSDDSLAFDPSNLIAVCRACHRVMERA